MTEFAQSIITILLFIFILGALVVIHELGHFVTARLMNVRVLEFGVGFPPRAKVLRNKGETVYTLNWLPIGGFVKLEGEDGDATDDPRAFSAQSLPRRLLILVAGVAMNVLLAFVIFTGIALYGDSPLLGVVIVEVAGRLARGRGRPPVAGDTIVSLNGSRTSRSGPTRRSTRLRIHAGETVTLDDRRRGRHARRDVEATLRSGRGRWRPARVPWASEDRQPFGGTATIQSTTNVVEAVIRSAPSARSAALGLIVGGLRPSSTPSSIGSDRRAAGLRPGRDRDPDR